MYRKIGRGICWTTNMEICFEMRREIRRTLSQEIAEMTVYNPNPPRRTRFLFIIFHYYLIKPDGAGPAIAGHRRPLPAIAGHFGPDGMGDWYVSPPGVPQNI